MVFWKQAELLSQPDTFLNIVGGYKVEGHFDAWLQKNSIALN